MDQGLLPRRYAKALYKYAVERDVAAQMYTVMDTLTKAYDDNAPLQATIANPFVDNARKASILATAAEAKSQGKAAEAFDDFVNLLGRHRRMDIMRETALAYLAIYRREHNIYKVHITFRRHTAHGWINDFIQHPLMHGIGDNRGGGVSAHAPGIGPGVAIAHRRRRVYNAIANP